MSYGLKKLTLYWPAVAVPRAAIVAASGGKGGKGERRIAGADEDLLTLAWEAAQYLDAPAAPLLWAAGGNGDGLDRSAALLCEALGRSAPIAALQGNLRAGWDVAAGAFAHGHPWVGGLLWSDVREARADDPVATAWSDGAAGALWGDEPALELLAVHQGERWLPEARQPAGSGRVESDYAGFVADVWAESLREAGRAFGSDGAAARWAIAAPTPALAKRLEKAAPGAGALLSDHAGAGFAGCAEGAFLLARVVANMQPGERVALWLGGTGSTALLFRATAAVARLRAVPRWESPLRQVGTAQWSDFRRRDGAGQAGPGASAMVAASAAPWAVARHAGRCPNAACGALSFPLMPRCHVCGSDGLALATIASQGSAFTYTVDHLHGALESPTTMIVADMDGGGRVYLQGCDDLKAQVAVGQRVEMALRRLHDGEDLRTPHYFWKLRTAA